ncbi:hypothetical protein T03_8420 [Trichinella britovi]|uniref:Uncharacterized protein n=1 Tax=Trichinella britovi TaxID=45882 RepID=A0A0V1D3P2_TRIBR|nr:hypothetical protein T03_8420 [Trichinella britovi]
MSTRLKEKQAHNRFLNHSSHLLYENQFLVQKKFITYSVEKSFLYTCSSIHKTPHGQNIAPGTKTTVNNGIAIKRSQGERHAVCLPQLRWSDVEKASK